MKRACATTLVLAVITCPALGAWAAEAGQLSPLVVGNTSFALDLYRELSQTGGNLFFSPFSLSTALAMTYAGADGDTAKEMTAVLHFPPGRDKLHRAFGLLIRQMLASGAEGYRLHIANALWAQEAYPFLDLYINTVKSNYGARLENMDFVGAADKARQTINAWVEEQTENKIKELLKPGVLDSSTRLVLTNAVYFKGDWAKQFDKKRTRTAPFYVAPGMPLNVPMMNKGGEFPYFENADFQAVQLPYKGERLSMYIFLPRQAGGLSAFERSLTPDNLALWLKALRPRETVVFLPRFKITSEFSLADTLAKMGMPAAFSSRLGDFSRMSARKDLYIDAVVHEAYVDVNEEGTEAAAATGVLVSLGGIGVEPTVFRADHPFLFLIRDDHTGSILFIGRVTSPRESASRCLDVYFPGRCRKESAAPPSRLLSLWRCHLGGSTELNIVSPSFRG